MHVHTVSLTDIITLDLRKLLTGRKGGLAETSWKKSQWHSSSSVQPNSRPHVNFTSIQQMVPHQWLV